jgi:hypothetical protein
MPLTATKVLGIDANGEQKALGLATGLTIVNGVLTPLRTQILLFKQNGLLSVNTRIDGTVVMNRAGTIISVRGYRLTAGGTGGSTLVDVNINGTTIFTTQANRLTFLQSGGSNLKGQSGTIDGTATFVAGDDISVDVDAIETGTIPEDLCVAVEVQYT